MLQLTLKTARLLYSIIASVIIILFWRNIGIVTALFDIPGNSIFGLSIKALFLTLATLILTIVVIKPKELFSFLGLSENILKGFGLALLCVLPERTVFFSRVERKYSQRIWACSPLCASSLYYIPFFR